MHSTGSHDMGELVFFLGVFVLAGVLIFLDHIERTEPDA
jgi:hypothetical protein